METNKYFTAIFFDDNKKAYKYRNIKNNEKSLQSFTAFALTKKATQINFYNSATKIFCYKVFLKV
jgi:hypothetical protein